uniref:Ig-like domain-containing protein n=1 Tax=Amphilophus citrinellus TaxID=61819 RepID=A0A3Q0T494_AMPCI
MGVSLQGITTHTLTVCFTGLLGEENWPEFVGVALVDGFEVVYCDSNTMTAESRQDWMKKHDPAYLNWFTNQCRETQRFFSLIIEQLMQNFNPTKGVHTFQRMLGCEFDDVTDEINGINQFGYDGEDFITFDLKTHTRIPAMQQAVIFKQRWDNDKAASAVIKNYLTQVCPEMLKMFVNYGRSFMLRTALLSVSLLQKSPSSPVTCHATGFSTNRVSMVWRKDGVELHEGVGKGDILPNDDGTFQMSVDLQVSSVRPEDWEGYDCVFQLSDVYKAIVTKLDKAVIRVNKGEIKIISHQQRFIFMLVSFMFAAITALLVLLVLVPVSELAPLSPAPLSRITRSSNSGAGPDSVPLVLFPLHDCVSLVPESE